MNRVPRTNLSLRSGNRYNPKRLRLRRVGTFEILEVRLALSADSIDGRPFIDLGPSDNVALDQPRVVMQLIQADEQIVGPDIFNTFLLDTGANTILAFQTAVSDMNQSPPPYRTEGTFSELGVGGSQLFDISAPYRFDYAGNSGERNTLENTRIISDDTRDLSIFGPWGIVGMSAMSEKVTTLDFTPWTTITGVDLFMGTDFSSTLPTYNGPRYSLAVDNRVAFTPEGSVVTGLHPPVWSDLPFLTGQLKQGDSVATGNMLFDTGAQVSILSTAMALSLGLDSNLDGVLDSKDANFAREETVGGIGGTQTVPVFLIDQLHLPTQQGTDLVWTDLQWLVLDIVDGIDAVFGFDNMTSGWIEAFAVDGQSGYIMQSQLDFRNWEATGRGTVHYDINPEIFSVVDPNGPGAIVKESGGVTTVSEIGATDSYQLALSKAPTANVRVNLSIAFGGQITAASAANPANAYLDFTPSNWNFPQTVVVSAVNDATEEGLHRSFVRHISTSTDARYQNVGMPRVIVNVIDNDFAGVMILPTGGSTNVVEGGEGDTYQLVLTFPPTAPVTLELENAQNQVRALATVGGASFLVFTAANWNIPQSVSVTAVDDTRNEGLHKTFITHRINTTDANYQQAFSLQETAFVTDNDSADTVAPQIVDVIVGSFDWNKAFIDGVDGGGTGAGNGLGISLPGVSQLSNLTQNGINKIYIKFSENVGSGFDSSKFALAGTNRANYMQQASIAYGVDGANVVTISLPTPITRDALVLSVLDTMIDIAGNRLDGEWVDGVSMASGNGTSRGRFNFRIDVLPGDVDDSNGVNTTDVLRTNSKIGTLVSSRADAYFDINGNSGINTTDLLMVNSLIGSILPSAPSVPSLQFGTSNGGKVDRNNFRTGLMGLSIGGLTEQRPIDRLIERRQSKLSRLNLDRPIDFDSVVQEPKVLNEVSQPNNVESVFKTAMLTAEDNFLRKDRFVEEYRVDFPTKVLRTAESALILNCGDSFIPPQKSIDIEKVIVDFSTQKNRNDEFLTDDLIAGIVKELDEALPVRPRRVP